MGSTNVSMELMKQEENEVIPAMPDDPFDMTPQFTRMLVKHRLRDDYHEQSFIARWRVSNIPVKPLRHRVDDEQYREALANKWDRTNVMHPQALIRENIGSNMGLARIMRSHYVEKGQHQEDVCQEYTAFNADLNIFERMLKVQRTRNPVSQIPNFKIQNIK